MSHVSPGAEEGCGVTCFALWSKKHLVSHVSLEAEEGGCVTCLLCTGRSILCHMCRPGLMKAVVSHVSSVSHVLSHVVSHV